ncbi:Altronate oxidoreductase [[Clostridium] cellulosi]|uniref:Mannitol-1-phosphate 5-dehydrogenase n=1 Tax=[Clostridium] cellulosi TaxID=29343 RepID=A0A078KMC9_9FIRM|nr:Altronate oxidoreductase [[Clostridium] cellulosi]
MKNIKETVTKKDLPEKVLQIGEGNFLRAFADWMINTMNNAGVFNGSVVISQPIARGMSEMLNAQDCVYTVLMRGIEDGKVVEKAEVITSVSRCINPYEDFNTLLDVARNPEIKVIISNTTEAGIAYHEGDKPTDMPPQSYPAKMTVMLHERYLALGAGSDSSILILPVELIERNGDNLKKIVLQYATEWGFEPEFIDWLKTEVCFANTLVDRIVSGFPRDEINEICEKLGYEDNMLVTCEPFHSWVIEAPKKWAEVIPFDKVGLHVIWTDDMTPYRTRKVRILNGAHTVSVLAAYLSGYNIVREMLEDKTFNRYLKSVLNNEIIPNIKLPREELDSFAAAVLERFSNPFIKHKLLDISLNSVSKFKARCLDSLLEYTESRKELPDILCFGFAALMEFYKGEMRDGRYYGKRNGEEYEIRDNADVLAFFNDAWKQGGVVKKVLSNTAFWGRNLLEVPGLEEKIEGYLSKIEKNGMRNAVEELMEAI